MWLWGGVCVINHQESLLASLFSCEDQKVERPIESLDCVNNFTCNWFNYSTFLKERPFKNLLSMFFSILMYIFMSIFFSPEKETNSCFTERGWGRGFPTVLWSVLFCCQGQSSSLWIPSAYPWNTWLFFGDFHPRTLRIWPFLTLEIMTKLSKLCCLIIAFTNLAINYD